MKGNHFIIDKRLMIKIYNEFMLHYYKITNIKNKNNSKKKKTLK